MAEGDDNKPAPAPLQQALQTAAPPLELRAEELRGHSPLGPDELVKAARDGAHELLGQQRALDAVRMAIGIGAPGNIDLETGTIRYSPNFGWKDVALGDHIRGCLLYTSRCV